MADTSGRSDLCHHVYSIVITGNKRGKAGPFHRRHGISRIVAERDREDSFRSKGTPLELSHRYRQSGYPLNSAPC